MKLVSILGQAIPAHWQLRQYNFQEATASIPVDELASFGIEPDRPIEAKIEGVVSRGHRAGDRLRPVAPLPTPVLIVVASLDTTIRPGSVVVRFRKLQPGDGT